MTCRECENAPTRLCVACYEREQYGEQWHYVEQAVWVPVTSPNDRLMVAGWVRDWKEWAAREMRVELGYTLTQKAPPKESL